MIKYLVLFLFALFICYSGHVYSASPYLAVADTVAGGEVIITKKTCQSPFGGDGRTAFLTNPAHKEISVGCALPMYGNLNVVWHYPHIDTRYYNIADFNLKPGAREWLEAGLK